MIVENAPAEARFNGRPPPGEQAYEGGRIGEDDDEGSGQGEKCRDQGQGGRCGSNTGSGEGDKQGVSEAGCIP
jgi:hypothetical protein